MLQLLPFWLKSFYYYYFLFKSNGNAIAIWPLILKLEIVLNQTCHMVQAHAF